MVLMFYGKDTFDIAVRILQYLGIHSKKISLCLVLESPSSLTPVTTNAFQ